MNLDEELIKALREKSQIQDEIILTQKKLIELMEISHNKSISLRDELIHTSGQLISLYKSSDGKQF